MLKRKRSGAGLLLGAPPPSSGGAPPLGSGGDAVTAVSPHAGGRAPAPHLPGRTLKRFRDGRPSDGEVHEHTLGLLYSAQQQRQRQRQQQQHPASVRQAGETRAVAPPSSSDLQGQCTLHRFWSIHSAPSPSPAPSSSPDPGSSCIAGLLPASCEDCGAGLDGGGEAMDLGADAACVACGKPVCFSCSVSNLGDDRHCLRCAGRGAWIGGPGLAPPMPVVF